MKNRSYKQFTGFSTAFRQWKADSHCRYVHGYAIKKWFKHTFDHTTIVAKDDPYLAYFQDAHDNDLIQLRIMDDVGCEKFAEYVFKHLDEKIKEETKNRVRVHKVQCWEHEDNMAEYCE